MVFTMFISLYTTRFVLVALGMVDYGIYKVVCGFVSMFAFLTTSMSNGIQRFFNYELGKNGIDGANRVFMNAIVIQSTIMVVAILLCETFGVWFLNSQMTIDPARLHAANWIFQFSMLSVVFAIMAVPFTASIMAHERMDYYAIITIFDAICKFAIALMVPYLNIDNLIIYGFLMALVVIVDFFLYFIYSKHHFAEIKWGKYDSILLKQMIGFSGWNILGTFTNMMKEQGVNVLLNAFFNPAINAARGVSYQVTTSLRNLSENITVAVKPQMVQSYARGEVDRALHLMFSISKMGGLFFLLCAYPIMVDIEFVLRIWLGDNVPDYTNIFVRLVFVVSFIGSLNSAISSIVHATGKMRLYQITGSLSTILVLPASYLWLKFGGRAVDVFIIAILFAIIMQTTAVYVLTKLIPFRASTYCKEVLQPIVFVIIVSSIFPIAPRYFMDEGFLRFVIITLISLFSFGCSIYHIALNDTEKNIISQYIMKFRKK